jgi:hypothetical protein
LENRPAAVRDEEEPGVSRVVTIAISDVAASRAQEMAERSERRLEEVLAEWIDQAAAEPPVDSLPDEQVRALCEGQLPPPQQQELSDLLALQREGQLDATARAQLDQLMQAYRRGLVRKAQALQVAVARGLIPPLG